MPRHRRQWSAEDRRRKARAARGLTSLTDSALAGVRKMPPHGGTLQINDLEIKRAITYMVNHSGGRWNEPIDRTAKLAARGGAQIVQAQCVKCHGEGVGGAPRLGDKTVWIERAKGGLDSLVASAIHGHGAMPSRAGARDVLDVEAFQHRVTLGEAGASSLCPERFRDLIPDNRLAGSARYFS